MPTSRFRVTVDVIVDVRGPSTSFAEDAGLDYVASAIDKFPKWFKGQTFKVDRIEITTTTREVT